jgi:uncharacterized protein YqgV (UPF0045/DUF77 family)
MWTVIYMAKSKELIARVQAILNDSGLAVRVNPIASDVIDGYFEILVPEIEAQNAHMKLIRFGY